MAWQAGLVEFPERARTDLVRLQDDGLRVAGGSEVSFVQVEEAVPSVRSLVRMEGPVFFTSTHRSTEGIWVSGAIESPKPNAQFALCASGGALVVPSPAPTPPAIGEWEWSGGWGGELIAGRTRQLARWTRAGQVVGLVAERPFHVVVVGDIVCGDVDGAFVGLGPRLERLWTRDDLGKQNWVQHVSSAGGHFVVALERRVVALSPQTGETVWEVPVLGAKNGVYTATSGDDRVTVQEDCTISVIDAHSGRVLSRFSPKLGKGEAQPDCRDSAYSVGEAVLYSPYAGSLLRVFGMDGSRQLDLVLPNDHFIEQFGVDLGGTLALSTKRHAPGIGTSTFGLLVVRQTDSPQTTVAVEPRPVAHVEKRKQPDGKDRYEIRLDEPDFDRLIRFARIEIKELAHLRGSQVWGDPKLRNRKFDGHIAWLVPESGLTAEQKKVVEWAARDAEFSARVFAKAGDGKGDIHVRVEFVRASVDSGN